jgi:hypothetical protein
MQPIERGLIGVSVVALRGSCLCGNGSGEEIIYESA